MLGGIPTWFKILFVVFFVMGISSAVIIFQECGAKALLFGNGAAMAAMTGMCD